MESDPSKMSSDPDNNINIKGLSAKALFDKFQEENKDCYWNPHLEESVKNMKYIGCIHPSTLLICGRDIYLDTVKSAWARKVLRAPANFYLLQVGK